MVASGQTRTRRRCATSAGVPGRRVDGRGARAVVAWLSAAVDSSSTGDVTADVAGPSVPVPPSPAPAAQSQPLAVADVHRPPTPEPPTDPQT